jgi:hypothetical protein
MTRHQQAAYLGWTAYGQVQHWPLPTRPAWVWRLPGVRHLRAWRSTATNPYTAWVLDGIRRGWC